MTFDIAYPIEDGEPFPPRKEPRCKYGYKVNGCELGHPGCACADEMMARCTGECLPGGRGCNCEPEAPAAPPEPASVEGE